MSDIVYAREPQLAVDDYVAVIGDSTLGPGRPLQDRERVAAMLAGADLIVSARLDGQCVGVARGLTDFAWVCYLGDLAVRKAYQGRGIGRGLLLTCKQLLGDGVSIALLSMHEAKPFYDRVGSELGLRRNADAYYLPRTRGV